MAAKDGALSPNARAVWEVVVDFVRSAASAASDPFAPPHGDVEGGAGSYGCCSFGPRNAVTDPFPHPHTEGGAGSCGFRAFVTLSLFAGGPIAPSSR